MGRYLYACLLAYSCWFILMDAYFTNTNRVCGDGYCLCKGVFADCKGKGLEYVPRLKRKIALVDLSYNNFTALSRDSFVNIHANRINLLVLSFSKIHYIEQDTFTDFKHLRSLILGGNPIAEMSLARSLTVQGLRSLKVLNLDKCNITNASFIGNLKSKHLTNVRLNKNFIKILDLTIFSKFRGLKRISAQENSIFSLIVSSVVTVETLELQGNDLTSASLLSFCEYPHSYLPRLQKLSLVRNNIRDVQNAFRCLPKLRILELSRNPIETLKTNSFSEFSELEKIKLTTLTRQPTIAALAFNSSSLIELILSNVHIDFSMQNKVDDNAFKGMNSLEVLTLSVNNFKSVSDGRMMKLFGHLGNLTDISMGGCSLRQIPKFLSRLKHLQRIYIYRNLIETIPLHSFSEAVNLKTLWLNSNKITTFNEATIPAKVRNSLIEFRFFDNPLDCDCNLRWFISWMHQKPHLFKKINTYVCVSPLKRKGLALKNLKYSVNDCYLPFTAITVVIGVLSVLILAFVVTTLLFINRWKIRHYIYLYYHRPFQEQLLQENIQDYKYDAYIIHSEEDEAWVLNEMIPCLEDVHHLKLCVENRDFHPGAYILANIDEAIQTSRHIIVVLSTSFVESEWCQTEVTMAQSFVMDNRRRPLLSVVLEEPDSRNMRHSLHVLLRSSAYIIWGEEEEARELFWRRLVESIV